MTGPRGNQPAAFWKDWLRELVTSKALTLLEPETAQLPGVRLGQARFVSGALGKSPDDAFIQLRCGYGRNTTLAGIWMFLAKDHKREYLVTAFGKRKGSSSARPAAFHALHVSCGGEHSVAFARTCVEHIHKHIAGVSNAEVLVCHNHQSHFVTDLLSQIIDWSPLPSNTDRETMSEFKYRAIVQRLRSGNLSHFRFFLVEHGRLREISMPSVNRMAEALRAVIGGRRV